VQSDATHTALTCADTAWSACLHSLTGESSGGGPRLWPAGASDGRPARLRESEYSWLRSVNRLSASASCTPRAARASRCVKPCWRMRASSVRITCGAAARPAGDTCAQRSAHAPGTRRSRQGALAALVGLRAPRPRRQAAAQRGGALRRAHLQRVERSAFRRAGGDHVQLHGLADRLRRDLRREPQQA